MKAPENIVRLDSHRQFLRVLVPVDFTPGSVEALRFAGIVAERFGSTVHLLHVIEVHRFAVSAEASLLLMDSDEEVAGWAAKQLSRLAREELSPELAVRVLVRRGQPAFEILRAAEDLSADLLVQTARQRSAVGRLLLGSTLARLERHAPCPVLVVWCKCDAGAEPGLWRKAGVNSDRLRVRPAA